MTDFQTASNLKGRCVRSHQKGGPFCWRQRNGPSADFRFEHIRDIGMLRRRKKFCDCCQRKTMHRHDNIYGDDNQEDTAVGGMVALMTGGLSLVAEEFAKIWRCTLCGKSNT